MDKNIEQLNKLAKLFNADKIITADEIDQILKGVLKIMTTFKKENEDLTSETKSLVENIISEVSSKYEEIKSTVDEKTMQQGVSLSADFDSKVKEIKDLIEVVKTLKPENGKDADEERVIEEVLSKIKLPEYKETVLDDGVKIAEKLNGLEEVIDQKVIKGLAKKIQDISSNIAHSAAKLYTGTSEARVRELIATTGGSSGSSTFIGLTDTPSSYTGQALKVTRVNAGETALEFITLTGGGDALTSDPLSQFAPTTSAQLAGVISDETGTGKLVFAVSPVIETPTITTSLTFDYTTVSTIAIINGTNQLISADTATYPSLIELTYVKGGTSSFQTQLNARVLKTGDTITGTYNLTGQLNVDNLRLDGNTLSSTDTNGNLTLAPNGTGSVLVPDGSTSLVGLAFNGATGVGISKSGTANTGMLMAGGSDRFSWNTTTFGGTSSNSAIMKRGLGSDSTPTFSNLSDTNTGLVLDGSDVLGLTTGGVRALNIDASQVVTIGKLRATPRVTTITSNATPTVNTDDCEFVTITALAVAITSMTTNLSGTPANFQPLTYRIKDDGTARTITWGASFASRGATLPTTTTLGKVLNVGFRWNSVASTWDCIATNVEA